VIENRLYTGSTDGTLRIWTLKGLRRLNEEESHPVEYIDNTQPAAAAAGDDAGRQQSTAAEQ